MLHHFDFVLLLFQLRGRCSFCSWRQKGRKPTPSRQLLVCSVETDEAFFSVLTVSVHSSWINQLKWPLTLNNSVKNAFFNCVEYEPTLFLRGCVYSVCIHSCFSPSTSPCCLSLLIHLNRVSFRSICIQMAVRGIYGNNISAFIIVYLFTCANFQKITCLES